MEHTTISTQGLPLSLIDTQITNDMSLIHVPTTITDKELDLIFNTYSIKALQKDALLNCDSLNNPTISAKKILTGAISKCTNMQSLTLAPTVHLVASQSISNCYGLQSITISNTRTRIFDDAFTYCACLKDVYLPDDYVLENFRYHAFSSSCSNEICIHYNNRTYTVHEFCDMKYKYEFLKHQNKQDNSI